MNRHPSPRQASGARALLSSTGPATACSTQPGSVEAVLIPAVDPPSDDRSDGEDDDTADGVQPEVVGGHDDHEQCDHRIGEHRRPQPPAVQQRPEGDRRPQSPSRCASWASPRTGWRCPPCPPSRTTTDHRTRPACRRTRTCRPPAGDPIQCTRRRSRSTGRRAGAAASAGTGRSRRWPARSSPPACCATAGRRPCAGGRAARTRRG